MKRRKEPKNPPAPAAAKARAPDPQAAQRPPSGALAAEAGLTRPDWLIMGGLFVFALVLRLWHLGKPAMWCDEVNTLTMAMRPAADLLKPIDVFPPLHLVLIRLTALLLGPNEWGARFSAALMGAATVPLQYLIARLRLDRRCAAVAGLVLAVSPFHIYYSRDAHAYGVYGFFGTLSFYAALRLVFDATRRLRWWAAYTLGTLAMMLTHYAGIVACGTQALIVLAVTATRGVRTRDWAAMRRVWLGFAVCALLVAVGMLPYAGHFVQVARTPAFGGDLYRTATDVQFPYTMISFLGWGSGAGAVLFVACCALGVSHAWRRDRLFTAALLVWIAVPFAFYVLTPSVSFFHVRRIIFVVPALAVFCGAGICALSPRGAQSRPLRYAGVAARVALVSLCAVAVVPALRSLYAMTSHDAPRREVVDFLERRMPDNRIVLIDNYYELRFIGPGYYKTPDKVFAFCGVWNNDEEYRALDMDGRFRAFLGKYPEAALLCTGPGNRFIQEPWGRAHFARVERFVNTAAVDLMRRRLFHSFVEGTSGYGTNDWRVSMTLCYNTPADVLARAQAQGRSVVRVMGDGYTFALTKDLRDWLALTREGGVDVYVAGAEPRSVSCRVTAYSQGIGRLALKGEGRTLASWRLRDGQVGEYETVVTNVPPGKTEWRLVPADAPPSAAQSFVLLGDFEVR